MDRTDPTGNAGVPEELDETKEERAENEPSNIVAASLQRELNEIAPGHGELLPPGYVHTADDIKDLENRLDLAKAGKASDIASGSSNAPREGIYRFTDKEIGKPYTGQSGDIPSRIAQHIANGKVDPNSPVETREVTGGRTAREVAERQQIRRDTGGVPARNSDKVANQVDPVSDGRWDRIKKWFQSL